MEEGIWECPQGDSLVLLRQEIGGRDGEGRWRKWCRGHCDTHHPTPTVAGGGLLVYRRMWIVKVEMVRIEHEEAKGKWKV